MIAHYNEVTIKKEGILSVNARKFFEIIRELPEEEITIDEIKAAPPMSEALKSFKDFFPKSGTRLAKFLPCGQNIRFDIDMLNAACRKSGIDLEIKTPPLELITYSQLYFSLPDTEIVANYKLTTVAQALGISTKDAHTALADVRMTLACLKKIFARFSSF